ncbi:MAG: hypothetical protein IKY18_00290 [Oscillospiraceae bacterium]|nr:hypothetical protein [Oscillospiraceae bacterium]
MNHILPESHCEEIVLQSKYATEFENFCHRNRIPIIFRSHSNGEYTYLVRAGIDYTDVLIMVLKMGWDGSNRNDVDVINTINTLVMDHKFFQPEYEYELTLKLRNQEDEVILRSTTG